MNSIKLKLLYVLQRILPAVRVVEKLIASSEELFDSLDKWISEAIEELEAPDKEEKKEPVSHE